MGRNGLIAGINWAIAATAVAGTIFVISQIFAPIAPATWSVGAPDYQVQQLLKSANENLPSTRRGMDISNVSQSKSTQAKGQQESFPKNSTADPSPAAGLNNSANQNVSRAPIARPQPAEQINVAPSSTNPPPSAGSEGLPSYMRYF